MTDIDPQADLEVRFAGGHTGPRPYSLILLGDDMYLLERNKYDPQQGTWRKLAPGDPGRSHR